MGEIRTPQSKNRFNFFKLIIFCWNFQDRQISRWDARIRCLFVQKYFGGASDKIFEHTLFFSAIFWNIENFKSPNTIFLNKNAPELSVSGTALTILKIWAKNIQYGKSYGESKFGSETLYTCLLYSALIEGYALMTLMRVVFTVLKFFLIIS